jgi:pimeloyl-ACP methyl ester carboxylesterase
VYVAAFALDEGESMLSPAGGVPPSWWNVQGDRAAAARLKPQPMKAFSVPVTEVAWRTVPSTYIVTQRDTIFPLEAEEWLAGRAGSKVVRMDTSHSPFLSRPEETADVIDAAG